MLHRAKLARKTILRLQLALIARLRQRCLDRGVSAVSADRARMLAPREARAANRGLRRDLPTPASIHVTSTGRLKQGTRRASPIDLRQSRSTRHPGLRLAVWYLRCRASSTRRCASILARRLPVGAVAIL